MNLFHTSVTETDIVRKIVDNGSFANMSAVTHYHSSECVEVTFLYHHGEKNVDHKTIVTMTPEVVDIWRYNEKDAPIYHECYFENEDGVIGGKIEINSREFAGDADCTVIGTIERCLGISWKDIDDVSHETVERNLNRLNEMMREIKDGTYRTFEEKISDIVNDIISNASDDDWDDDSDSITESK
jgi:hypothetical protein